MANPQDPRKKPFPGTVNETLLDRTIRHLLYLTGLQTTEANWMQAQLETGLFPHLSERIAVALSRIEESAGIITASQQNVLSSLSAEMTAISAAFMSRMQTGFLSRLKDIAVSELEFEHRLFERTIPVEMNFKVPSDQQLNTFLKTQPLDGKPLSEWFKSIDEGTVARINQQIRLGLINGESPDEISRRIRGRRSKGYADGVLSTTRHHALSIARSGVIFASSQAKNEFYRENADIIKGIQVIVTLDSRTCPTCMGYEAGNPYEFGSHPSTPFHPNCRCVIMPVVKSWRELGIDLDEAPEGTRSSMDGQVPASMTYNQWLRTQPREVVEQALGKTKAKLFLEGNLNVSAFTNRRGNILTLEELRQRERDIFERLAL